MANVKNPAVPKGHAGNRSVARALEVLELFAERARPLFVTEIAKSLKLPLSSCFVIIKTLERDGFLYALGSRRGFYPTSKFLRLAQTIQQNDPLEPVVGGILRVLHEETGETVVLSQRVDLLVLAIYVVESTEPVRFNAAVGDRWPLHSTSIGRSLLACLTVDERDRIIGRLELAPLTSRTIVDRIKLRTVIAAGQKKGWHISEGESYPDLLGISRAVYLNEQPFSVTVAGPISRMKAALKTRLSALEMACLTLQDQAIKRKKLTDGRKGSLTRSRYE